MIDPWPAGMFGAALFNVLLALTDRTTHVEDGPGPVFYSFVAALCLGIGLSL